MPFLYVRRKGVVNKVVLYSTPALAGGTAFPVRYDGTVYYVRLAAVNTADDSGLRARKNGTIYQVSTRKIPAYTSQLITTSRSIIIPDDVKRIRVSLIGGGGRSSYARNLAQSWSSVTGGNPAHTYGSWAGGNGNVIKNLVLAVTPGAALTCTVGAGVPQRITSFYVDYSTSQTAPGYLPGAAGIGGSTSLSQNGQVLATVAGGYSSYNWSNGAKLTFVNYSGTYNNTGLDNAGTNNCGKGGAPAPITDLTGAPVSGAAGNGGYSGGIFIEWGVGIE